MRRSRILLTAVVLAGLGSVLCAKDMSNVVLDKRNSIYWEDDQFSGNSSEDWDDAVAYCEALVLGGMAQWRLPTFKELFSIVDYGRVHPAIDPVFKFVEEGTYWTSTDFAPNISRAWTIDFRTGKSFYSYKTTNHTVRCVKDVPEKAAKGTK